jgi:hypothetical protein
MKYYIMLENKKSFIIEYNTDEIMKHFSHLMKYNA